MSMNESDRVKRKCLRPISFDSVKEADNEISVSKHSYVDVFSLGRFNNQQMHCESNGKCTADWWLVGPRQLKSNEWNCCKLKQRHSLASSHTSDVFKSISEEIQEEDVSNCVTFQFVICLNFIENFNWNGNMRLMMRFWLVWARGSNEWGSRQNVVALNVILSYSILPCVFVFVFLFLFVFAIIFGEELARHKKVLNVNQ